MKYKILLAIIVLASVLRLWQIGNVPPSLDWDEAALGYNAYSILETGRDEYGEFMPVVLRSFDDYKPALYTYLIIPFIAVLGLSEVAVRLPSALFGIIAVILTYLLVKELLTVNSKSEARNTKQSQNSKSKKIPYSLEIRNFKLVIALLSAGLLAVSPWHIQFSRVAFETNVGLTLNLALIYFFLKGLRSPIFLSLSAVCAGLSIYAYQSEKIFVPLLLMLLAVVYRNDLLNIAKRYIAIAAVVFLLVVSPMAHYILTEDNALQRAQATSIFTNNHTLLQPFVERLMIAQEQDDTLGILINNRRVVYAQTMVKNYLHHYNPLWLFITGDSERHHAPDMGLLYLWELPFVIIGIVMCLFSPRIRKYKKTRLFLLGWFLIAPLPAVITTDVPHAVRTLNFLPTHQIFTAIGLISTYVFIRQYRVFGMEYKVLRTILYALFVIFISLNFIYYLNQYFVVQNRAYSQHWQYGYKEAVAYVQERYDSYDKILVSNTVPLDQSHIFFLYHLQYPPHIYQKEQGPKHQFAKYEFRAVDWERDSELENTLIIAPPEELPDVDPDRIIWYLNGEEAMRIVSTD